MDQVKRFAVGESGLLASSAVDALNALGADVGELVGASVETGVVGTMTQHLAGDGSGVAVHSTSTPDGFNLAVFSVTPNGSEAILRSWFERRGEALVLPATIDGGACVVVVSSQRLEPAETDGIVELNHEAFTEAATAYPRKNLALLRTDRPGAASHQLRLAIAHAMTSGMLAATRTAH